MAREDETPPAATEIELRRVCQPVPVDRRRAVRLGADAASDVCDGLGRVAKEGFALARKARPGDVYELVASEALQRGLDNGVLRVAQSARGDASVLVKNAKTGRIAGKQDLMRVKPKPASLLG